MAKSRTRLHAELIHQITQNRDTGVITNIFTSQDEPLTLENDIVLGTDQNDKVEVRGQIEPVDQTVTLGTTATNFANVHVQNINSNAGTANLYNDSAPLTINFGGSATDMNIGDTGGAGTTTIHNAAQIDGNVAVGSSVFTVDSTNGNTYAAGTFNVDGATTLDGNVTLGDAAADTVTIEGTTTVNGNISTTGTTTLGDAAGDTVTINGNTTIANTLTVTGAQTYNGAATFNGGVTIQAGDTVTLDGIGISDVKQFTIKNSAGTTILGGYLVSTSNAVATP